MSGKLTRLFFVIAAVLVAGTLVVLGTVKFLVGPAIARQKIESIISKVWAGEVQIETVEFNLFKPLEYKSLSFLDPSGRRWAYAETLEVTIENRPSARIKIEEIKLDTLELTLHPENPAFKELFNLSGKQTQGVNKKLNLPASTADNISISISDDKEPAVVFDGLSFSAKQDGDLYTFSVVSKKPSEKERLEADGAVNLESLQTDVSLVLNHSVSKDETAALTESISGEGHIASNITLNGSLKDPNSLKPVGSIRFSGWSLSYKDLEDFAKDIDCTIALKEKIVDCETFSAVVYNGATKGDFKIDYSTPESEEIRGTFEIKGLQLAELAMDFERLGKVGKGTANAEFTFSVRRGEPESLNGHGFIEIQDSDLYAAPLTTYIFTNLGLKGQTITRMADGVCVFSVNGPVITIQEAKATSDYAALVVEPGGTIDLQKNRIDAHVIAVPVRLVRDLLNKIPFMSIITNPKDKLTRFRVEGSLSDPPSKLVRKEAFKDIKAGTVSFFKEVINAGGELKKATIDSTHRLYETLTGSNSEHK